MSLGNLKENNLTALLPRGMKESLVCYTLVSCKVIDGTPDIVTCHTNGSLYEIKNKKILRSLNLTETASSVSCYYLLENEKIVLFYVVFIAHSKRLLIIRGYNKHLKIVKDYDTVKDIKIDDFECLGFPQIKITFLNEDDSLVCKFPIESDEDADGFEKSSFMSDFLTDELQMLNTHIDDLTEEYNQLKKLCFSNNAPSDFEDIFIDSVTFSAALDEAVQPKLMVLSKWLKVLGSNLILGMKIRNTGNEVIHDMEVTINHRKIKDYAYSFFQSYNDLSNYLSSPRAITRSVKPGQDIYAAVTFQVPAFFAESEFVVSCYVTCSNFPRFLFEYAFEVKIQDVASRTTVGLEEEFAVEDLMAVKVTKSETRVQIRADDLGDRTMDCLLTENLGFKRIKHVKDKLFYCTSTYLNEVFVAIRHVSVNPSVWKLVTFTSDRRQLFFLVNALYDLLPENAAILLDED